MGFYATIFTCLLLFISTNTRSVAQSIRPINAFLSVEDNKLRDFTKSVIQTYLLYSNADVGEESAPSFIFISGNDYISDGKINKTTANKFFPGMSEEERAYFHGASNVCLVFTLPLKELELVVGVNNTSHDNSDENYRCVLDAISYYLDKDSIKNRFSDNIKEYGRNIISDLQKRY